MKDMHSIGKFIIVIPVMVVLLAFLFNSSEMSKKTSRTDLTGISQGRSDEQQPSQDPLSQLFSGKTGSSSQLDLEGPLVCGIKDETLDVSVRIYQKNIYAQVAQEEVITKVIVKDGDLYKWTHGEYTGEKIVGVGQYLTLLDTFSGFITPDMIFSMISQVQGAQGFTNEKAMQLKDSCIKKEFDQTVFTVPSAVTFEEVEFQDVATKKIEPIELE